MFFGMLFLLVGVLMLLDRLRIIHLDFGEFLLPVALIALGISFMFKSRRSKDISVH